MNATLNSGVADDSGMTLEKRLEKFHNITGSFVCFDLDLSCNLIRFLVLIVPILDVVVAEM